MKSKHGVLSPSFLDKFSFMKSMKRHEYKYFPLELITIFLCDISFQRPVFKHRRDLVGNGEIADLPTSSRCIYEPVSSCWDVRYGTFIKSSLFVSTYHISSYSLHFTILRSQWIILIPLSWISTSILSKSLSRKKCSLSSIKRLSEEHNSLSLTLSLFKGWQCWGGPSDSFCSWEGERLYSFGLTHCFFSPQRPHQEISGHWPSSAARQHEGELVRFPVSLNHISYLW